MKITLFLCAGNYAETLGVHRVSEMAGIGRRMPLTTVAFTIGALGMIGVPPLAGFISKWYLASGALAAGQDWVLMVLAASSLLNAAYFLPILYRAWFQDPVGPWSEEQHHGPGGIETHWMLLWPAVFTAALAVLVGLLANTPYSPLEWARLIAEREYAS
jgi:multicomponent Na+:H+ antiporter subunit D